MLTFFNSLSSSQAASSAAVTSVTNIAQSAVASHASMSLPTEEAKGAEIVAAEMDRRATNIAYGIGRLLGKWLGTVKDEPEYLPPASASTALRVNKGSEKRQENDFNLNGTVPLMNYYNQLFSQETIRILYIELDPGVDDYLAMMEFLSIMAKDSRLTNGKKIEIVCVIPSVGNAILPQTILNTLKMLAITNNLNIKVYPGANAPLAIENNQTAIIAMESGINATHFYGYDGLEDIGGWPQVNIKAQTTAGHIAAAQNIYASSPDNPITLISTSVLTNLAKTLIELERLDQENGLPAGSFANKIAAISMMGGCVFPATAGCNAPFNVPDNEKTSEANFYFGVKEAQLVFSKCQQYGITILLAPLDLTQQPGLLWTKELVTMLTQMNNPVASQTARLTNVIPYLDAPCFANQTWPDHDGQAATAITNPSFYDVTPVALTIGNIGQIQIDLSATQAMKNVLILSMNVTKQAEFYQTVLQSYHNFDCLAVKGSTIYNKCNPSNNSRFTTGELLALFGSGALLLSGTAASIYGMKKYCKKENVDEEKGLLATQISSVNNHDFPPASNRRF
jgi:inosine-uridine nucleoside N-ribohydrolase